MAVSENNLIWIDLEMTGLDPQNDQIIEIATVVTDSELNELAEGPVLAIHQPDGVLAAMDEWNTRQHGGSGLTERVRESRNWKTQFFLEPVPGREEFVLKLCLR